MPGLFDIDATSIPDDQIPAAIAALAALQTALVTRLMTRAPAEPGAQPDDDTLLTAAEAAAMLRRSPKWLYRRSRTLPFAHRLDGRSLVFSKRGLEKWLARQKG